MIRIISIVTMLLLLSACETTRESKTGNIGAATTTVKERSFDKKKAAANRVNTGLTYLNRNNYQRAKFHLDKALEYDPKSGDVHYAFGLYFQRVKELKKAEDHFKEAMDTDSRNGKYLNAYGAFLCERNQFKQADKMFHKAIDIPTYPDVASAFFNVALCAVKQNQSDKAESYFRKALNRDRNMAGALIEMAKIEYTKQRYTRAMSYLKRFENNGRISSESAWLGLRTAHYMRDKDSIARYGLILEQRFPDSDETAEYLDDKKRWM
ncbi:type IV pilus biogenesis/stability protein PilW [Aliikangiella coralliicola]|uniref:Type IV pilus biogenesis/stability protein PilW n=1 Tax=Aliikangiella coralliicola TaxID=2592383 RepID=A0A545UBR2_9GAMM|nr:type IV pilus biogenesis/stability protein PilW [Aliikangiella coralliicola]TQV86904.1 type IV pilus biogenesis/stability protein PilW [Aliikangiella coralliicola]